MTFPDNLVKLSIFCNCKTIYRRIYKKSLGFITDYLNNFRFQVKLGMY